MGTINISDRIAVFLKDMVCLRYICINTLHKGNNNNIYLFTAIGLSPCGSGYLTQIQNMKLVCY
jgi:hypothetical protein